MQSRIDGKMACELKMRGWTWAEIGIYIAQLHRRMSKDGKSIPYQEKAVAGAAKKFRVSHIGE